MRRTISGMIGAGSLAHNRRDFVAENVDPDRVHLNICYQNENLKEVYKELFDDSVKRYNMGKRKDRQITNYYEKIRQGKQEKLFHEKRELMHHIAVALAGREAEALLLGPERVSTGASNDIEKAALIAQRMVCEWGMLPLSDEVCLFSQQQKDQAAQQWLSQGRLLAAGTLRAHQAAWERLTRLLMERESVDGEEVARCLEA